MPLKVRHGLNYFQHIKWGLIVYYVNINYHNYNYHNYVWGAGKKNEENLPFACQYTFFPILAADTQEPFCSITTNDRSVWVQ